MRIIEKRQIGQKNVMPFTIPSGIVTTELSCLERIAQEIPEIGILTTKSIGPQPRAGNREPILAQYMPGGFVNAVGLTNPGAEDFAKKLSSVNIPQDKFLLASIFGKDASEFVYAAKTLEACADGFELNLSCPHAKGYGMQLGQDPQIVYAITQAVAEATKKPIFAKLTPNAGDIGDIAKAAVSAGAYGIAAINTVGPGCYSTRGHPVLTNKVGGLSGIGITPIGLKCVRDIKRAVGDDVPIIGMGGIRTVVDVEEYAFAGANFFGIGSALVGMNEKEIKQYFSALREDLDSNGWTNNAALLLKEVNMGYAKARIDSIVNPDCDFKIFTTCDTIEDAKPGQFVFAWLPGIGEKPFSVMDNSPLTLGILERGEFTKRFSSLKKGDSFYFRGPYGASPSVKSGETVVLVGGGCGIAGLYFLAKRFAKTKKVITFLGAKDKQHLPYLKEFENLGEVRMATEDGSSGRKGLVTDLLQEAYFKKDNYFFNCGPKAMVEAVLPLELGVSRPERVYSSVDYMTRCGVGMCGSCADKKGRRTCVEGPFVNP
jgi:dihydroorotate dehydrogenase (NAD+) catalytic subunit